MALIDIFTAANDETFQGRCMAAAWQTAQNVIAEVGGYDVRRQSKDFALSLLRGQTQITAKQVAVQILRNSVIAANIAASTDTDILFQAQQIWKDLMSIG